jgi:CRP-like cAMP-binding protein
MLDDPFQHSALDGVAPFDGLPRRVRRELAIHADRLRLPAGTVVVTEGTPAREFVQVVAGEVVARDRDGAARVAGPGTTIGAAPVLAHAAHPASWVALTDVELVVIDAPAYRWFASQAA